MILVYSPKPSQRLNYVLEFALGNFLGLKWEFTSDKEHFAAYEGPRINYSALPAALSEIRIEPAGLLHERGIRKFSPLVESNQPSPRLFPAKGGDMDFDPFAAVFYLLSRYEEYLPFECDEHGRFDPRQSLAYKHGFLEIPLVDHYCIMLGELIGLRYPELLMQKRQFSVTPTYDIDIAFAYQGRGFIRSLAGAIKSLLTLKISDIRQRARVIGRLEKDPFDTYALQLEMHQRFGLRAFYFFLCGDYGPFDKNISFYAQAFHQLVQQISDSAYVGIHPSYGSGDNPDRLSDEIRRLSQLLKREIRFSRQHYLRISMPKTYRQLIQHNISNDFSMGYASLPGFRAGTCSPFLFYDLEAETIRPLKIFPFAVMDGTLRDYMKLSPEQATDKIKHLVEAVRNVGGNFCFLWHNDSLSESFGWKGWRQVYLNMLNECMSNTSLNKSGKQ